MTSPEGLPNDDAVEDLLNEAGEVDDAKVADALGVSQDDDEFKTLKYSLLGPSLTKAGQDSVDQTKVRLGSPHSNLHSHRLARYRKSFTMLLKDPSSSTEKKSVTRS